MNRNKIPVHAKDVKRFPGITDNILVSFVHGYENLDIKLVEKNRPALWQRINGVDKVYNYPFPRSPEDFKKLEHLIFGTMPNKNSQNFKKLPRFGFTGIQQNDGHIYVGSWNSIYEIECDSFELKRIITNNLMSDMHGICVTDEIVVTVLTSKDTVVFSDMDGNVIEHFSVLNDLNVVKDESIEEIDWRFISKQFRGSTGYWHFNYVQKFGDEIWLTSRNANAFVVVDIKQKKAWMRLMNLPTPVLLHDGIYYKGRFYFTSIDGKIIITEDGIKTGKTDRENVENIQLYNRDLVSKVIRLNETSLDREPNWCRGIACKNGTINVTIDGRYDTELSFGLLSLTEEGEIKGYSKIRWSDIGEENEIRYVTGFDILIL